MPEFYKPFVLDVFHYCYGNIHNSFDELIEMGMPDEFNVAAVAGQRGRVIAPLAFMMCMLNYYPSIPTEIFGMTQTAAVKAEMNDIARFTSALANNISIIIGRNEPAGIDNLKIPSHFEPYKSYSDMALSLMDNMAALCRSEIEKEGECSERNVARIHGPNESMAATLEMVVATVSQDILRSFGRDVSEYMDDLRAKNEFVKSTHTRVKLFMPTP